MDPGTVFALGAALYSSVGQGGASAYIAAMALFSVVPESMKPTALALNLLVAGFGAWRYWSRDLTNWKLVFAFAVTASPAAFVGGGIHLPAIYYKALVGIFAVALGGPSPVAANHSRGSRGTRAILLDQPSSRCGPRPARRPDRDRRRDFPQPLIILNA